MKLICPQCQRENEPERIYCHECGARLDRSVLAKKKQVEEDPQETHRRVAKMFDPSRGRWRLRFFQASKLILAALVAGAIVQMLRAPDVPPRPQTSADSFPPQINIDLEDATMNPPRHGPMRYSDEQVNAYLAYVLKSKQSTLSKYLQFERLVVGFEEGYFHFAVERSLFGYPLYTSGAYSASIQNGNIITNCRAGYLGRMPIHPALMRYGAFLFADVCHAVEREQKLVAKLASVEFHPKLIVLTPKPPQP